MGKGDKKTKRGKIVKGTYGVNRPKKRHPQYVPPEVAKEPEKKEKKAKK